jgi:hypothetical protein
VLQPTRPRSRHGSLCAVLTLCLAATAVLGVPTKAAAQQLRADVIAAEQAAKAKHLGPGEPTTGERIAAKASSFIQPRDGLYPYMDSVYGGGGFTLGAGFLRRYGDTSTVDVHGLYSIKKYKLGEVTTISPGHLGGRLLLDARLGWRDATQVGYYGLGIDTSKQDRAGYRFKETYFGGAATLRPVRWAVLAGGLGFESYDLEPAQESEHPQVEDAHTPVSAPGLGADPSYVHSEVTGGIDWRTSPGYTRTGGYYGLTLHTYADTNDTYSFNRLDATVVQNIPVLNETWVLSLRGRMQTTLGDDVVPYFLMPSLGGGSVLRAYSTGRFRDRHALITTAEWRWFPNRTAIDEAIFFDAGTVAGERADLWSERMKTDWGIGGRFHGPAQTPLRIELAHGSDGWKLVLSGKPAF